MTFPPPTTGAHGIMKGCGSDGVVGVGGVPPLQEEGDHLRVTEDGGPVEGRAELHVCR